MNFPERDWKHLRAVQPVALARYCERALAEAVAIIEDAAMSAPVRYQDLAGAIAQHNERMRAAFDDMRRSRAVERLASLVMLQLLTDVELAQFSPEVRMAAAIIRSLDEIPPVTA